MSLAYQENGRYFALAAGQLEKLAAEELQELGVRRTHDGSRGVFFEADPATVYRINYESRLITRVLAPLTEFQCHSDRYLYTQAQKIDWSKLLTLDTTFAVFATVSNSKVSHSQFAARRLKDAIVDQFREATGKRPSVRTPDPDVWLNLHIHANYATISVDTSGGRSTEGAIERNPSRLPCRRPLLPPHYGIPGGTRRSRSWTRCVVLVPSWPRP